MALPAATMDDIRLFDAGTLATVELRGTTSSGGDVVAVRVVMLGMDAPWWSVVALAVLAVVLLGLLLWRRPEAWRWRVIVAAVLLGSTLCPVILGWVARSYDVVGAGLAVGLLAAGLALVTAVIERWRGDGQLRRA
ncbi:MAG: hypothetical protein ACTHKX_09160 [Pseudolysinimonas sp.]